MCSMPAHGHPLSRLQRALSTGDARLALDAARELDRVPLADAFGVCLLLRGARARYDRACVRWLERFAAELEGATLADVQLVAESFQAIRHGARVGELDGLVEVLAAHRLHRALAHLELLDATARSVIQPADGRGRSS
jgi:hypothetical protein